jgi:hypothetical protein
VSWWSDDTLDRGRWGELIGPVLERIAAARDRGKFPHALLLTGPAGLGRELAAIEAAVLLTCEGATSPWTESSCADRVRRGLHPDVVAVLPGGASQQIKIDQVRGVVDSAAGRPFEGLHRVWIFDGVEAGRFGAEAANAFLKTLEEPPDHVRFLLLAANPTAVLPTIRSRCQALALPGALSVAHHLGQQIQPELTATVLGGHDVGGFTGEVTAALGRAFGGDFTSLLRLPGLVDDGLPAFEVMTAVAIEMSRQEADADRASELVRLASDLLVTDRRTRGLNLNRGRQLSSCLMRWYQELQFTA